jgi:Tfp pilus assembly protein PilN
MIKINLFDYREELNRESIQKRVLKSSAIVITFLVMILFSWLFEKSRISRVDMEVRDLEQQANALQGTVNLVKSMQNKQRRVGSILAGIESLRNDQLPATKILFDVNRGVPKAIWLTNIIQKSTSELRKMKVPTILFESSNKKITKNNTRKNATKNSEPKEFIEISGHALEDQAVARFVEQLEAIPYFKLVFLYKTEQTLVGQTPVRKFTIYCYMPEKPDKTVT